MSATSSNKEKDRQIFAIPIVENSFTFTKYFPFNRLERQRLEKCNLWLGVKNCHRAFGHKTIEKLKIEKQKAVIHSLHPVYKLFMDARMRWCEMHICIYL